MQTDAIIVSSISFTTPADDIDEESKLVDPIIGESIVGDMFADCFTGDDCRLREASIL